MLLESEMSAQDAPGGAAGLAVARQEIEYLRRQYALATDLLGKCDDPAEVAEAKRIYQRIFTPDANICSVGGGGPTLSASGPNGWAHEVSKALASYSYTQHLIGTQVVQIDQMTGAGGRVQSGHASMSSYLQAWHSEPNGRLLMVMATYEDKVTYVADLGWQIYDMRIVMMASDVRQLSAPA